MDVEPCTKAIVDKVYKVRDDLLKVNINLPSIFKIKLGNGQTTSFWHDTWAGALVSHLIDIGSANPNSPPRLLFNWAWRREPRTFPELEELTNLMSLVSQLHLSDKDDAWECIIDDSGGFTVKGMRSYITSMYAYVPSPTTRWNIAIPLKININTWRVLNGRLETRSNLDHRGIDLDSVRCPLCDDDIETEEHLFIHCKVAKEIWLDVLKWWRIPNVSFVTLHDLIHLADHTPLEDKFSSVFDAIVQTTIWSSFSLLRDPPKTSSSTTLRHFHSIGFLVDVKNTL
ncbi:RNA-directed DNA polymerase, eukaryota, reverse transcriptase zinc-binding domain protein [Tanacetum coccineum]